MRSFVGFWGLGPLLCNVIDTSGLTYESSCFILESYFRTVLYKDCILFYVAYRWLGISMCLEFVKGPVPLPFDVHWNGLYKW